jgi:hypothetical protein
MSVNDLRLLGVYVDHDNGHRPVRGGESIGVLRVTTPGGRLREIELSLAQVAKLAADAGHVAYLIAKQIEGGAA